MTSDVVRHVHGAELRRRCRAARMGNIKAMGNALDNQLRGNAGDNRITARTATIRCWAAWATTTSWAAGQRLGVVRRCDGGRHRHLSLMTAQNYRGRGRGPIMQTENLEGSRFGDRLTGSDAADVIKGGGGNDTISGGMGPTPWRATPGATPSCSTSRRLRASTPSRTSVPAPTRSRSPRAHSGVPGDRAARLRQLPLEHRGCCRRRE